MHERDRLRISKDRPKTSTYVCMFITACAVATSCCISDEPCFIIAEMAE